MESSKKIDKENIYYKSGHRVGMILSVSSVLYLLSSHVSINICTY